MNELTIQGKKYISSKHAAEITGYAKDYVGQLCREGYIEATMVGRSWYALELSIMAHRFGKDYNDRGKATSPKAEAAKSPQVVEDAWVPAVYAPEPLPALIPTVADRHYTPAAPIIRAVSEVDTPVTATSRWTIENLSPENSVIPSMQEAWQEWFSNKKQQELLETEEVIDQRDEGSSQNEQIEPEEGVLAPQPVAALSPVAIPVYIAPVITEQYSRKNFEIPHPMRNRLDSVQPVAIHALAPEREDALKIPRMSNTTHLQRMQTAEPRSVPLVAIALLTAVTVIVCAAAFVGSGLGDKYINASVFHSSQIVNFLEGKSVINRQ